MEQRNLLRDQFYFFAVLWALLTFAAASRFLNEPVMLLFIFVAGALAVRYWVRRAKRGE